jgi:GNAT superfamily N-acetyltransferase
MKIIICQAMRQDVKIVSDILGEAARWLDQNGMSLWKAGELSPSSIGNDVNDSLFFLAECNGEAAGTVKFQLEDLVFWPDVLREESAFIHRLAVKRNFAGGHVSSALLQWAVERTRSLGRRYLRLDCVASRPRLRAIYDVLDFGITATNKLGHILFPATNMRS